MRLKEKTHRKFVDFFEKMSRMYQGNEFELAYSEIQRETGTASVTLKRAIQALETNGVIEVEPGRNSRYARFRYLSNQVEVPSAAEMDEENMLSEVAESNSLDGLTAEVKELMHMVEHLLRRIRTQELLIAALQERLVEVEDKVQKR